MTEHGTPRDDDPELTRPVDQPTVSTGAEQTDLVLPPETGPAGWHGEPHPSFDDRHVREGPGLGYYLSIAVAVAVVVGLVGTIVFLGVKRPVRQVAGAPVATSARQPTSIATRPPTRGTTPTPTTSAAPRAADAMSPLAEHPMSTSDAVMTAPPCALTRFDPANDRQAAFYQEAKVCADAAWRALLPAAGLPATSVSVVTVHGGPATTPCGTVEPADPPTQCQSTVYMTPAHLRDVERNDRFPGRYFGVFLREYARAIQDATGLTALYTNARKQPGAVAADLDRRLAQQATCLAGIASGAMAGQGAVDANITAEIRDRLSTVDAPPDAATWLDRGFQTRRPAACNTWAE